MTRRSSIPPAGRGAVELRHALPERRRVAAWIIGNDGRIVNALAGEQAFPVGSGAIRWAGKDGSRRSAASGVYWPRFDADGETVASRGIVLREWQDGRGRSTS